MWMIFSRAFMGKVALATINEGMTTSKLSSKYERNRILSRPDIHRPKYVFLMISLLSNSEAAPSAITFPRDKI